MLRRNRAFPMRNIQESEIRLERGGRNRIPAVCRHCHNQLLRRRISSADMGSRKLLRRDADRSGKLSVYLDLLSIMEIDISVIISGILCPGDLDILLAADRKRRFHIHKSAFLHGSAGLDRNSLSGSEDFRSASG